MVFISTEINAQNIFVALNGDDSYPGTMEKPLKSIPGAINKLQLGDTIYVRGGVYNLSNTINISKNGNGSSKYYLFSYKDEKVLLDFISSNQGIRGIYLTGSFWHIKGINITGAGGNGLRISGGSNNIIELCVFYENRETGLQLSDGASNNRIINCDSYYNADSFPDADGSVYDDADGFAPKLNVGSGNYFYGCRSWGNCDDGWDGYMRGASDVATTLENCWTFENGYLKDGTDPGPHANGNGFKMGGGDNGNDQHLMHHFILKNCLAFNNKVKGFDQNNNDGSMTLINCTGFGNKSANYRITRQVNTGQSVTVENCVSFNGEVDLGSFVVQNTNSWMSLFNLSRADFVSIDTTGVRGSRKPDGSLPDIDFMHLAAGSDLIDAGTDVGIPYTGSAPDLGAFEFGMSTPAGTEEYKYLVKEFTIYQNYPNPFNPTTTISFRIPESSHVKIVLYDILGKEVTTLVDEVKNAGYYKVKFNASSFAGGVYFYRMKAGNFVQVKKMSLLK